MAIGIVLLIFILINGHSFIKLDITWLQSPRITPWGVWGPEEFCSTNSFVIGVRLKMERKHVGDNTALNAVQLVCTTMYREDVDSVTSTSGRFGEFGQINYCPSGFATGYQLRSQTGQGNVRDDVAAVDFKLICTDFNDTLSYAFEDDNRLLSWGDWTQERRCPSKTAVCGIRTQVEELGDNVRQQDETTLNNLDVACCPISKENLICQLRYNWETRMGCPVEEINCEIRLATGMIENRQLSKYKKIYDKLKHFEAFDEYVMNVLKIKAERYAERINYNSLKDIISKTQFNKEISPIGVRCEGIIQQLVVTCDFIQLYTYENRCVPDLDAEMEWEIRGLHFRPSSHLETIFWSYNCHFTGPNIAMKTSEIVDCGDICLSNLECTHFVWNKYNGGTCWLKGLGTFETPIENYGNNFLCGWVERPRIALH